MRKGEVSKLKGETMLIGMLPSSGGSMYPSSFSSNFKLEWLWRHDWIFGIFYRITYLSYGAILVDKESKIDVREIDQSRLSSNLLSTENYNKNIINI